METKDHNKFSTLEDMKKETERNLRKETKSDRKVLGGVGFKVIGSNDGWTLYHVFNRFGAIKLGTNSRWCVSTTGSDNFFNYYSSTGTQFYVLKCDDPPAGLDPLYEKFIMTFHGELGEDLIDANNTSYHELEPDLLGDLIGDYDVAEWALDLASEHAEDAPTPWQQEAIEDDSDPEFVRRLCLEHKKEFTEFDFTTKAWANTVPIIAALPQYIEYLHPSQYEKILDYPLPTEALEFMASHKDCPKRVRERILWSLRIRS
jgi:hypothetical protein